MLSQLFAKDEKKISDDALFKKGFYNTLAQYANTKEYGLLGSICSGTPVDINLEEFISFPVKLQNLILAYALPLDLNKYSDLLIKGIHNKKLCSFAGKGVSIRRKVLGAWRDSTYYLYRAHYYLTHNNLSQAIQELNLHFQFCLSSDDTIDDFFSSKMLYEKTSTQQRIDGPLVSIIMCAKNEEKYLARALISLLHQTWRNIEIIFIDDGSNDKTTNIFLQFAHYFYSYQYIKTEGKGLWLAKNEGLKKVTGQYVTFHDADDWSHPLKIERQIKPLLKNKQLKATSSHYIRINEKMDSFCVKNALLLQRFNPSSLMFNSSLLSQIGFFFDDLLGSDMEYVHRFHLFWGRKNHQVLPIPLMLGTAREKSLSTTHKGVTNQRMKDQEMWKNLHRRHADKLKKCAPDGGYFLNYLKTSGLEYINE